MMWRPDSRLPICQPICCLPCAPARCRGGCQAFVSKNPKVLTLLGPGVVNKTCLMAYMSQFDSIDTIKIKGSSAASATAKEMERFIKEKYPQVSQIVLCGTDEEAVKDADIISEGNFGRKTPVKWC